MKHSDYSNPCEIRVTKLDDDVYRLQYSDENFELVGMLDDVVDEIKEHLALMRMK